MVAVCLQHAERAGRQRLLLLLLAQRSELGVRRPPSDHARRAGLEHQLPSEERSDLPDELGIQDLGSGPEALIISADVAPLARTDALWSLIGLRSLPIELVGMPDSGCLQERFIWGFPKIGDPNIVTPK